MRTLADAAYDVDIRVHDRLGKFSPSVGRLPPRQDICVTSWSLLVDETGNFEKPRAVVAVVGVLARSDALPPPAMLRQRLSAAVPWAPWPLHAAHLMRPAFYLLAREAQAGRIALDAETIAGLEELDAGDGDILKQCRDRLAGGLRPRIDDLMLLERRLARVRYSQLTDFLDSEYWRLVSVFRQFRDSLHTSDFPSLSLVVSVERDKKGEPPGPDSPARRATARYLSLLRAIQVLTADALDEVKGLPHHIKMEVMVRDVTDPVLGIEVPLDVRHVSIVSSRLGARVVPWEFASFGPELSPALVLADVAALRVGWVIKNRNKNLPMVEAQIEHFVSLPVRSFATHIASVATAPAANGGLWRAEAHAEWVEIRAVRAESDVATS